MSEEILKVLKRVGIALTALFVFTMIQFSFVFFNYIFDPSKPNLNELELIYEGNVDSLDIDIKASQVYIETGDKFQIYTNDDHISYDSSKITQKDSSIIDLNKDHYLYIILPDKKLDSFDFSIGAGYVDIEKIDAVEADLDCGFGKFVFHEINTETACIIDSGCGIFDIKDGNLSSMEFDMGIGAVTINASFKGYSKIDCGIGSLEINLNNKNYCYKVDKGIGSVEYNHENAGSSFGEGKYMMEIDGGIGSIKIGDNYGKSY